MRLAKDKDGARTTAYWKAEGWCPTCGERVIPKVGDINIPHWAHQSRSDCDPWSEPESEWHLGWKALVPAEQQEVVMGPHRADIVTRTGRVVELQHSSLDPSQIWERERFYHTRGITWLWDARECAKNIYLREKDGGGYVTFRWVWPRKRIAKCRQPVFLDLGDDRILHLKQMHTEGMCGGWGYLITRSRFIREVLEVKDEYDTERLIVSALELFVPPDDTHLQGL